MKSPSRSSPSSSSSTSAALGEEPKPVSFEADVKPILREHCVRCHGDDVHKSDLNLQSYGSTLKGGSGGEVVIAGRPGASPLYQAIAREGDASPMPPNRPKIADAQVAVVRQWIAEGLRETADGAPAIKRRELEFKAPSNPALGRRPGGHARGLAGHRSAEPHVVLASRDGARDQPEGAPDRRRRS